MNLTVGNLRKIIIELEDDVILADLEYGNEKFYPHDWIKRLLLLEDENGQQYLAINRIGSHYTGEGEQEGVKYKDKYWDEESVLKTSSNPVLSVSFPCRFCDAKFTDEYELEVHVNRNHNQFSEGK